VKTSKVSQHIIIIEDVQSGRDYAFDFTYELVKTGASVVKPERIIDIWRIRAFRYCCEEAYYFVWYFPYFDKVKVTPLKRDRHHSAGVWSYYGR
jgi:hypothetical protein